MSVLLGQTLHEGHKSRSVRFYILAVMEKEYVIEIRDNDEGLVSAVLKLLQQLEATHLAQIQNLVREVCISERECFWVDLLGHC